MYSMCKMEYVEAGDGVSPDAPKHPRPDLTPGAALCHAVCRQETGTYLWVCGFV